MFTIGAHILANMGQLLELSICQTLQTPPIIMEPAITSPSPVNGSPRMPKRISDYWNHHKVEIIWAAVFAAVMEVIKHYSHGVLDLLVDGFELKAPIWATFLVALCLLELVRVVRTSAASASKTTRLSYLLRLIGLLIAMVATVAIASLDSTAGTDMTPDVQAGPDVLPVDNEPTETLLVVTDTVTQASIAKKLDSVKPMDQTGHNNKTGAKRGSTKRAPDRWEQINDDLIEWLEPQTMTP